MDLEFRVYPQGKSDNVASYLNNRQEFHDIIRPGEAVGYCMAMPELEPGSTGPYTIAADVTYVAKLSKDVPVSAAPPPIPPVVLSPPPLVRMEAPPPGQVQHRRKGPNTIWQSVTDLVGAVIMFGLAASSGYAVIGLWDRVFGSSLQTRLMDDSKGQGGCLLIPFAGLLNMAIVGTGGAEVLRALGWDGWLFRLDDWSWAHGLADGGMMLLAAVACQWPWIPLLAFKSRALQGQS